MHLLESAIDAGKAFRVRGVVRLRAEINKERRLEKAAEAAAEQLRLEAEKAHVVAQRQAIEVARRRREEEEAERKRLAAKEMALQAAKVVAEAEEKRRVAVEEEEAKTLSKDEALRRYTLRKQQSELKAKTATTADSNTAAAAADELHKVPVYDASVNSPIVAEIEPVITEVGALIDKPKLTDKYLARPPFRYVHDIISSFTAKHPKMCVGLFSAAEMDPKSFTGK